MAYSHRLWRPSVSTASHDFIVESFPMHRSELSERKRRRLLQPQETFTLIFAARGSDGSIVFSIVIAL